MTTTTTIRTRLIAAAVALVGILTWLSVRTAGAAQVDTGELSDAIIRAIINAIWAALRSAGL